MASVVAYSLRRLGEEPKKKYLKKTTKLNELLCTTFSFFKLMLDFVVIAMMDWIWRRDERQRVRNGALM